MAEILVDGAKVYFETLGRAQADQPPLLLLSEAPGAGADGSTGSRPGEAWSGRSGETEAQTGEHSDWSLAAALLARRRLVIVPDLGERHQGSRPARPHGFHEMAEEMVGLVRALGHPQVQVIGGDIALALLLEHPQVVRSAVLQATNLYADLERTANEEPRWIEALRKVDRPVLVIHGEEDPAGAPARRARWIAKHVPYAELWTPPGATHSLHQERLFEWIERVETFLDRRGSPAGKAVYRLGRDRYADQRNTIFDPKIRPAHGRLEISGQTLTGEQRREALAAAAASQPGAEIEAGDLRALLDEDTPWALCNHSVDDLRRAPHSLAERVSQVLLGEAVRLLEEAGDWTRVRLERDGYVGWAHTAALYLCSREEAAAYQASCLWRVQAGLLPARTEPPSGGVEAGMLPFGVRLPVERQSGSAAQVRLPDGQLWWVEQAGLLPQEQWPEPSAAGIGFTLGLVKRLVGTPYLWGGRSPFGFDCSGFAAAFWEFMGVCLPRDADQQFKTGRPVEDGPQPASLQPGDLLFFGSLAEEEIDVRQQGRFASITHVGVSLGGDELIHSNGAAWGVSYNSIHPDSPRYRADLRVRFAGARRYS